MIKNINTNLSVFIFSISTLITFVVGELYFYSTRGMDFGKYQSYLSYFLNQSDQTGYGQGVLYYYIISLISELRMPLLTDYNLNSFLSTNIQLANIVFYLFGLRGLYLILKNYGFEKSHIFYSFTFVNFFPATFEMRLLMKPEIAAFALLPWIILFLDKFFENLDYKYFTLASITIAITFTLKGSIFGMVSLFLVIKYFKDIVKYRKKLLILTSIFFLVFSLIYVENFNINGIHLLDHDTDEFEAWQNKASLSFIYHLNKWDFYYFPIRHYHNNSLIGITLFDTFGDYFELSFSYDSSYFGYERQKLFNDGLIKTFSRQYLALTLGIIFYLGLLAFFQNQKRFRIYLLSPLIGIFILLINAFGFPSLNFDPLTGDTFKVHYYSFLLTFSFILFSALLLQKNKIVSTTLLIFFSISSIYIVGFPKNSESNINYYISERNSMSPFCNLTNIYFDEDEKSNCKKPENICSYNPLAERVNSETLIEKTKPEFEKIGIRLITQDNKVVIPKTLSECIQQVEMGSSFQNKYYLGLKRPPLISLIYLIIIIIYPLKPFRRRQ